jgi:hypothetical protein
MAAGLPNLGTGQIVAHRAAVPLTTRRQKGGSATDRLKTSLPSLLLVLAIVLVIAYLAHLSLI